MIRWLTANPMLKLVALFLALGIVFVKAQERISTRIIRNVTLHLENMPPNFRLADRWFSPMIQCRVYGPKNVIDAIRADSSSFHLDVNKLPLKNVPSNITLLLKPEMFRTNLDVDLMTQFWVDEESIQPQQIIIQIKSWNINTPAPSPLVQKQDKSQYEIALHRLEKDVPVVIPTFGTPPAQIQYVGYTVNPESVSFAGRREALEQIQSVSTVTLDLSGISDDMLPIYLPLDLPLQGDAVPVDETVREVTVTINIKKK
jgi:YbbR domain-containing protein